MMAHDRHVSEAERPTAELSAQRAVLFKEVGERFRLARPEPRAQGDREPAKSDHASHPPGG